MTRGRATLYRTMKCALLTALGITLIIAMTFDGSASSASSIRGEVVDDRGIPIAGAKVSIWYKMTSVASYVTGSDGGFSIDAEPGKTYDVIAFADEESTPGVDYLPARIEAGPSDSEIVFILEPGASLFFEGDVQFVESEELPSSILFSVIDPVSGEVVERNGFPLVYPSTQGSQRYLVDIEAQHLIVPANESFEVGVNCTVLIGSNIRTRYFGVGSDDLPLIAQGERVNLDIRPYSIQFNLVVSGSILEAVESSLDRLEGFGFYTATERGATADAERKLTEASFLLDEGKLVDGFDACKRGFIELKQTQGRITAMLSDASFSVYTIIVFLALSSITISFLVSNKGSTKVLGGIVVYACTLVVLYISYPGSIMIPPERFALISVISIVLSITVAAVFPRFMRARGGDGHVPVRNIVVPIFSMAKRSIKRRRLRFALTLVSITVLVMSFVSLTSFSEGYGLIVNRLTSRATPIEAVLLRVAGYAEEEPIFLSRRDVESGWLGRQAESAFVSHKAENIPIRRPLHSLNGATIWGVLGFDPTPEIQVTGIASALMGGELPSEGEIAISEELMGDLGVELGEILSLDGLELRLVGVLDDRAFTTLTELDGSSYLPGKLVNIAPEGEMPEFILEQCRPSEVVVLHISNALKMSLVGVIRSAIAVKDGYNAYTFAERLALERGYWAWSGSSEGVKFARLGSYLEGKGLPLIVPWGIVILNVVVTMLNSMYERRREIHILSSVGLNPAQISAIFVAEATIIGVTAGGVGYLAGLGIFKGMAALGLTLEVRQKVSAIWSIASIGIAMTAVLMGAFAALRSSVIITPSLMRRWRIEDVWKSIGEPYEIIIPVRLLPEETEGFFDYLVRELRGLEGDPVRTTASIKVYGESGGAERRVEFVYKAVGAIGSNFYTKNHLLVEKRADGAVVVILRSYGEIGWVHVTGSMVRMIAMRWSVSQGKASEAGQ